MQLPPYVVFPTIASDNIILREILPTEVDDIVEISFYDAKQAANAEEALEMLQRINQDYQNGESIHWGIADKTSNIIMGTCGYHHGLRDGTGELGCVLRSAFRGQGVMTAAMRAAIDFGLHSIGLRRIVAITTRPNLKAIALLERLEFLEISSKENEITFEFLVLKENIS